VFLVKSLEDKMMRTRTVSSEMKMANAADALSEHSLTHTEFAPQSQTTVRNGTKRQALAHVVMPATSSLRETAFWNEQFNE
jgi:hypothetical protein